MSDLSKHEIDACRAVNKLFIVATKNWHVAEACDREYDAGEWSGPAWARNWEDEHERVIALVAERFGFTAHRLSEAVDHYDHMYMAHHPAMIGGR